MHIILRYDATEDFNVN